MIPDVRACGGDAGALKRVVGADMDQHPVRLVAQPVLESGQDLVRPESAVALVVAVHERRARTEAGPDSLPMKLKEQSASTNAASRFRRYDQCPSPAGNRIAERQDSHDSTGGR